MQTKFHHVQSEISELRQSLATVQVSLLSAVDAKLQLANCSQKDRDGKSLAIDIHVKIHTAKKHCHV